MQRNCFPFSKELRSAVFVMLVLAAGVVIELRGHSDGRESTGKTATISHDGIGRLRSQFLLRLLTVNGLPSENFMVTSVGEKEPVPGTAAADARNKRVAFHLKKKE